MQTNFARAVLLQMRTGDLAAVIISGFRLAGPSMSTRLSETSAVILDKYDGDINKLRDTAGKDLAKEKKLLKEFKVYTYGSLIECILSKWILQCGC